MPYGILATMIARECTDPVDGTATDDGLRAEKLVDLTMCIDLDARLLARDFASVEVMVNMR